MSFDIYSPLPAPGVEHVSGWAATIIIALKTRAAVVPSLSKRSSRLCPFHFSHKQPPCWVARQNEANPYNHLAWINSGSDWIGPDRTGSRIGSRIGSWIRSWIRSCQLKLEILRDRPKLSLRDIMERRSHWEFSFWLPRFLTGSYTNDEFEADIIFEVYLL